MCASHASAVWNSCIIQTGEASVHSTCCAGEQEPTVLRRLTHHFDVTLLSAVLALGCTLEFETADTNV